MKNDLNYAAELIRQAEPHADYSETRIYECHGTLDCLQCVANCQSK